MNRVLLVVDVQNDFCPGGSLPTPYGDKVVPVINNLLNKFEFIIGVRDWHPNKTKHFDIWPPHCIQKTTGAQYHPDLQQNKFNYIFNKGTGTIDNGYSAFEVVDVNLEQFLKQNGIKQVYIAGLTIEYCVKNSAIDAVDAGFETFVIRDAVEGIYQHKNDVDKAIKEMKNKGIKFIYSKDLE
jgi:nicotinamidase/pyrazinamidase